MVTRTHARTGTHAITGLAFIFYFQAACGSAPKQWFKMGVCVFQSGPEERSAGVCESQQPPGAGPDALLEEVRRGRRYTVQ